MRPPGSGSVPEGYELARIAQIGDRPWDFGTVEYKTPLSPETAKTFDLVPEPRGMEELSTPALVERLTGVPATKWATTTAADHAIMETNAHGVQPDQPAPGGPEAREQQANERLERVDLYEDHEDE